MSETGNNLKLKNILKNEFWTLKQLHIIEDKDVIEKKILFKNLPGVLIWDFFASNIVNQLIEKKNKIILIATGIDNVVWTYELYKVLKT